MHSKEWHRYCAKIGEVTIKLISFDQFTELDEEKWPTFNCANILFIFVLNSVRKTFVLVSTSKSVLIFEHCPKSSICKTVKNERGHIFPRLLCSQLGRSQWTLSASATLFLMS